MFKKIIVEGQECQEKFLKGIDIVDKVVGNTYGPAGRNRVLQEKYKAPQIINDGANTARRIVLDDPIEDMAAQTLIEVSMQTAEQAGDGSTTAVILGATLAKGGIHTLMESAQNQGSVAVSAKKEAVSGMAINKEIHKEKEKALTSLKKIARETTKDDIDNVVATSMEDHEYGPELAKAIKLVGKDGYIAVEDNWATKHGISTETTLGMRFLGKTASGYMANSKNKKEAVWDDTLVLVTNEKFEAADQINGVLEQMAKEGKRRLVIFNGYSEGENPYNPTFTEAISKAIVDSIYGVKNPQTGKLERPDNIQILAVRAQSLTTEELEDVAVYCDAKFFDKSLGLTVRKATVEDLGYAKKVSVNDGEVNVLEGRGNAEERIAVLTEQMDTHKDPMFKEKLKRRIASLKAGQVIIRVGAPTDTERSYIKEKLFDSVSAAKAALEEGIVPGGGLALAMVAEELGEDSILYDALMAPSLRIRENGFDGEITDKVLDPLKVVRLALENACSGAGLLITSDAAIAEEKMNYGDYLQKVLEKAMPQDNSDFRAAENRDLGVPEMRN